MPSAYRRSSAVVTRRAAVIERLRRALFSPSKILAVGALTLAFAAGNAFAQEALDSTVTGELKTQNYNVQDYKNNVLDLTGTTYNKTSLDYSPYSIALNGGTLYLTTNTTSPICDIKSETLYVPCLTNPQANETVDLEVLQTFVVQTHDAIWNQNLDLLPGIFEPAPYSEWIKILYGEEEYQKYEKVSLESIYENNKISQAVVFQGHYLDLSAGGTVNVANMPLTLNPAYDFYYSFLNSLGVSASAQTINGEFTKSGNGALVLGYYQNPETQQITSTEFKDKLNVNGGFLNVYGDGAYQKEVTISGGTLIADAGKHTFNAKVEVKANGSLDVLGGTENPIVFNDDVTVDGGALNSWGNVSYNGSVSIRDSNKFTVFSGKIDGVSDGSTTWGTTSKLTIANAEYVFGNANSVNVDLTLSDGGVLHYVNIDRQLVDSPYFNKFYITLDEKQTPTVLEWTAGSSNIKKAIESGNVITQNLTSVSANTQLYFTTMGHVMANQLGSANGYTVVFNNADGKKFDYAGKTMVDNAFMVVQGDTNFGSFNANAKSGNISHFTVFGEAYSQVNNNTWRVYSSGMLGFDRDDAGLASTAPSITADWVEFASGVVTVSQDNFDQIKQIFKERGDSDAVSEAMAAAYFKDVASIGGSRIWVDATFNGNYDSEDNKTLKLGAINANTITFGDNTQIWYDGISAKPSDVKMTFDLNASEIQYQTTSDNLAITKGLTNYLIQREILDTTAATVGEIEDLFGAAVLVDATYVPVAATAANDETNLTAAEREAQRRAQIATAGAVTISAKNVGDYAAEQGMTAREQELAQKLDGARVQGGESSTRFYDALYNETEGGKVRQTIHNLSLLGYNMLNAQGHFGNPTSSFFGGASLSGEAKRGQSSETDWPSEPGAQPDPSAIARPTYNPNRSVWAAYTHTAVDGDDYDCGGVTTHGYKLRRDGIIGGIRRQADATTSAGLFFGLSMPEVQSRNALNAYGQIAGNGYGTVGSKMEMTDFQFAGHVEKVFADVWELALYAGGGAQSMDWERDADLTNGGYYKYEADGAGNTLTGTIYLSYRADLNDALTLRPTIGVDSEHSWLYGFQETATVEGQGGAGNVLLDPYTDMFAQAYDYKKTYYNRNTARVGLSLAYSDPRHGLIGLNGRVFYGVKLGGDDAPELSYYSENYRWEDMTSHEMGDSSLTVGGGGFMHLNPLKTLTATGAVNAIWYDNAQTFNVTGGVSYRF